MHPNADQGFYSQKKQILTSDWSAQQLNAGQKIQHIVLKFPHTIQDDDSVEAISMQDPIQPVINPFYSQTTCLQCRANL